MCMIIKYWFKILSASETKYVKLIYRLMLNDIDTRAKTINWASLLRGGSFIFIGLS